MDRNDVIGTKSTLPSQRANVTPSFPVVDDFALDDGDEIHVTRSERVVAKEASTPRQQVPSDRYPSLQQHCFLKVVAW